MKRRDFLRSSVGVAGAMLPLTGRAQAKPCAPGSASVTGGTSVTTTCSDGGAAADWATRSRAPGVIAAYDFSGAPANGGDWKWGSLSASPKVTVQATNESDPLVNANRMVDTTVFPAGSKASLRWDVPSGTGERADMWRMSIDSYADQFGENSEFWIQWRTRMNKAYAEFLFLDRSASPGPTTFKHTLFGEGMQATMLGVNPAYPHGFEGQGTSQQYNHLSAARTDFEGEIALIGNPAKDATYPVNYGFKYPSAYHGKPGYAGLYTRGTDNSWFTHRNGGNESNHAAACQYQIGGAGYRDKSSCFIYPSDEWFTLMVRVVLGPRGHGMSSLGFGYRNIAASRIAPNQIRLTNDTYVEHFNPAASAGKWIRVRGSGTGSVDARVTVKDNSTYPGQALLTLTDMTGPIQNESLQVDEYENGFTDSTIEYYGAYAGQRSQLLHRRSGLVLRVGNYVYDANGYSPTARFGTFGWTTFMTGKSLTQSHPLAQIWVSQIVISRQRIADPL